MLIRINSSMRTLSASFPITMAAGKAMNCVKSSARTSCVLSNSSAVPKVVAISMTV